MSVGYRAVGWNRQKKIYDTVLLGGVMLYLTVFIMAGLIWHPNLTAETLLIRALGTCALVLLHVILIIGPLCRLDERFLPLLYNRRHMGVTMFVLALAHGAFAIFQFHALGNVNPLLSVLTSNTQYASLANFPFEILGVLALTILFLMAATSHDFWLANLTAPVWKALHMMVYLAYALIIMHVTLGFLQAETSPIPAKLIATGMGLVLGLHLRAAMKERELDQHECSGSQDEFVAACAVDDIPENRAQIVTLAGERVAIFKYGGKISAVSNVCQHQNGPLGEGRIIDGCITCPWHGYQYLPENGSSPPPFTEKIPTFDVKIENGRVFVRNRPNAPGTFVEPARIV
ncbi:ferric reductase-like transmembrane domain-containing protein [candidate division KSB1 bacterium]|nr:ferric reductase-like transmembrane domain-containing protein [candidate division KSB1 bacterium]